MMDRRLVACSYNQVVATYNSSTENPGNLRDALGALLPTEYQCFKRRVVAARTSTQTIANLGGTINSLAVSVTVTDSTYPNLSWVVSRFISQ